MKKYVIQAGLLLPLGLFTINAQEPVPARQDSGNDVLRITIIYDNYQTDQNLRTDWGFACLMECQGHRLLFDAGRDAGLYKENSERLQIESLEIPALFISHGHGDHTAAIPWITAGNSAIACYLPSQYAAQLETSGTLPPNSRAIPEPVHLYGPYYSTGDNFKSFREQGLIVKTGSGGVLITGCGHPGVVAMVDRARNDLGIQVHTVIGGLHLLSTPGEDLNQITGQLKKMGIKQICPTHCTGDESIALLKEAFGDGYIPGGAGKEIIIQ